MAASIKLYSKALFASFLALSLGGCSAFYGYLEELPPEPFVSPNEGPGPSYIIGPLDVLNIHVWRNPDLTRRVTVRPDGSVSIPLIPDIAATGKTAAILAEEISDGFADFMNPQPVTVMVDSFNGPFGQQVRVVGEAGTPRAIPYIANMTLLDVMIQVGGLTEFAAGNQATLIRFVDGEQKKYRLRIDELIRDGNIEKNVKILPGDVLIIPESIL